MKTIEEIAREVAETATLSDTPNPKTGAYEPVIKDLDQLAAFIEDGILADRAQRNAATSASDRYDAARAALAQADEAMTRAHEPVHVGRLVATLRALVEHPSTEQTIDQIAARIEVRLDMSTLADYSMDALSRSDISTALRDAVHAGIQAAWEDWEPENAPGMVDTRATDVIDIVFDRLPDHVGANFIETEDAHGRGVTVGKWVTRPDGRAALRIEVVR